MINFRQKLSYKRHQDKSNSANLDDYDIVKCFESDRGRILNSAAIRLLQQKTQVFPLERNAVVRSRLTHSMEVQQVGRYIVKEIINRLQKMSKLNEYGLQNWQTALESLVEMACLMHDIGNPPFGHFGEDAINQWFAKRLDFDKTGKQPLIYPALIIHAQDNKQLVELKHKISHDLVHFEGNAQAIRLVHTILQLNLTYSQIASILKYTRPAYWNLSNYREYDYLMKKPGYYLSEEPFIKELSEHLSIAPFHRYPLTYIMEAADDISYCIADLEDAVEKKIFTVDELFHYLQAAWGPYTKGDLFDEVINRPYLHLKETKYQALGIDQFFMYLRVNTAKQLVPHAAERFIENIDTIYNGSFNHALLEDKGAEYKLLYIFKKVSSEHVFTHESVENLELQGNRIITGLLDIYGILLEMPMQAFLQLATTNTHKAYPIETRLFHKLSAKPCVAYLQAIEQLDKQDESFPCLEFYYRARLLQDYISGMTDHYAYDEYRNLMVTF